VLLRRAAFFIVLSRGWRRALIAFLAGALSSSALAPVHAWPVLFATFPALVWMLDGSVPGARGIFEAAATGWSFGFGYFLAGLYWIGFAFLVDAKTFGWLLPFAVVALPAGMAVYTGLGLAAARLCWTKGPWRVLTLAVMLTMSEWLRGHLFGGFPWNAYGYALASPLALAQAAALIGIWGLTFVAVFVFASPAVLADETARKRQRWFLPILSAAILAGMAGWGAVRLARTPTTFAPGLRLRVMQPNLSQDEKFNYSAKQQVMDRYVTLSNRPANAGAAGLDGVTYLIWPESAFPFFLAREPGALAQIAELLPRETVLITGGARIANRVKPSGSVRAYNSVYVIDHEGSILAIYDKVHLVPFGEFLPFQEFLERLGFMQLTKVQGGFVAGARRKALQVREGPPFLPLICYEIIFPDEAVPRGERPRWLLNLTNDGWFGNSSGPYQHFDQARVRAIEQGLPLVRAANTGISAVVDPVGRVIEQLPLGTEGVLDGALPQPLEPTSYLRFGDAGAKSFFGLALVLVIARRLRAG
jgi:apolipoprotein N-acyltransferase